MALENSERRWGALRRDFSPTNRTQRRSTEREAQLLPMGRVPCRGAQVKRIEHLFSPVAPSAAR